MVYEILSVDLVGDLKFALVENLFEHARGYGFVCTLLRRFWICRAYQRQRHEQQ
jgi:hypothetical protein